LEATKIKDAGLKELLSLTSLVNLVLVLLSKAAWRRVSGCGI